MKYLNNCVNWPRHDVGSLTDMVDSALQISRKTFLEHVDKNDLKNIERNLGYADHHKQGLTMSGDCYVAYYRSKLHGKRVYFFTQSAIEYVFHERTRKPGDGLQWK